ncbi:phosphomannomutase [Sandarakinorhabdus cyanobacteriorum]|uniref:Phosphomannomutase n=2 Tax=Sandarakinorhabdus cyanobacteriorum TaxID=1981098 RepID=A0A255Y763_9SPHN|nr:phosphomannomutase [Sandarakinorhabdus cyanobacteriorum]OYQ25067.1 phosphomannomutase [Sandarakinorhabdus cyanobacteriorum]
MTRTVADCMNASGVAFGTSGARGLVTAMSDRVCHAYTTGFLGFLQEVGAWRPGMQVALAGDLRPSTPRILAACAAAVRDAGGLPLFCGYQPTPALAAAAFARRIPSLMVTGSHIPDDRNGIKFFRPDGEVLKADEAGMARQIVDQTSRQWDEAGAMIDAAPLPTPIDVATAYVARYVDVFGPVALAGRRIGIYQHSAVGRDVLVQILAGLGAEVLPLGRSERFIPVDTEAVRAEDQALARQWAADHGCDAIASTDGDSDRPLLADEHGEWLRGDILGLLCARMLGADVVVTPVSSNNVVERIPAFTRVERTRIGSPYVIAAMDQARADGQVVCGYEANGGFLLGSDAVINGRTLPALPTRDAVLPIVAALVAAGTRGLAALVRALPPGVTHSDRLPDFAAGRRDALMDWLLPPDVAERDARLAATFGPITGAALEQVNLTDGVRMLFANGRVIHLRGSGNAPELRCYTEAESPSVAAAMNGRSLALVAERFPG